jgi:hypothetical protein
MSATVATPSGERNSHSKLTIEYASHETIDNGMFAVTLPRDKCFRGVSNRAQRSVVHMLIGLNVMMQ